MNARRSTPLFLLLMVFACIFSRAFSQAPSILMEKNKQQHPGQVLFSTEIPGGKIFIEATGLKYAFYNPGDLENIHEEMEHSGNYTNEEINQAKVNMHAMSATWLGATFSGQVEVLGKQPHYRNYFTGNNPAKWSSEVPLYEELVLKSVYPGIDLRCKGEAGNFKQDWIAGVAANPALIKIRLDGADAVKIENGDLLIKLTTGSYKELAPYAYQDINGSRVTVPCQFKLENNILGFHFPEGYSALYPLVIDPVLIGSTYSGSTATIYGHSATYDDFGNMYAGGRAFGVGYPVSTGAYQVAFGGNVDISISKYSANATSLIYATYLGGSADDYVHSMYVSAVTNELFILGTTGSSNFPVSNGCFQNSFGGGVYDIIVSRLNPTGTALLASTYVGGNGIDGQNQIFSNYGDSYRGEIILHNNGDVLIASFSSSANFPTTVGAYRTNLSGAQDGVVFRMPPSLNTMSFSTFIGGTQNDATYGIRIDGSGNYVICGGTESANFPVTPGVFQNTFAGGSLDGWIGTLSGNGSTLINSTFYGTASNDQVFFIDTDNAGNIGFLGQTDGNIVPTPGCYAQPNGSLFTGELTASLASQNFVTIAGTSVNNGTISPTAFLIDRCEKVYISGWGSTTGLPVSVNAIQNNTDGSDFYLLVMDINASAMLYATYFGDNSSWEHVDGGTSRFDKRGIVYQAICEGGTGLQTTPGAYSPNNMVGSYDIAVFKIDFQQQGVTADAIVSPSATGCAPFLVNFTNQSTGALNYLWDFGDGSPTSTAFQPSHTFLTPGTYQVMVIAIDSGSCNFADTAYLTINVGSGIGVDAGFITVLSNACGGFSLVIQDTTANGHIYDWDFGDNTAHSTVKNPTHTYLSAGPFTITLIVRDTICDVADTVTKIIQFDTAINQPDALFDYTQIPGCNLLQVNFQNQSQYAHTYQWTFGDGSSSSQFNPSHVYVGAGNYLVTLTVMDTICNLVDVFQVNITIHDGFSIDLGPDGEVCDGQRVNIGVDMGTASYLWSTGETTPYIEVTQPGIYWVEINKNGCVAYDSIYLFPYIHPVEKDTLLLCPMAELVLHAGAGKDYLWFNGSTSESITIHSEGTYWFEMTKGYCRLSDTVLVKFRRKSPDVFIPNTFSPNNDGLNEEFFVVGAEKEGYEMMIYNRWGSRIYYSSNPAKGWDGTHNGQQVPSGVYVWRINYKNYCMSPADQIKLGNINVLR